MFIIFIIFFLFNMIVVVYFTYWLINKFMMNRVYFIYNFGLYFISITILVYKVSLNIKSFDNGFTSLWMNFKTWVKLLYDDLVDLIHKKIIIVQFDSIFIMIIIIFIIFLIIIFLIIIFVTIIIFIIIMNYRMILILIGL